MDMELSAKDFWKAIGARAIGATIVTAADENGPAGFVALSATHFSASPPTMTVAIGENTSALKPILETGMFAINFLSAEGRAIYERFSSRDAPKGAERFAGFDWSAGAEGLPIFKATTAVIECRLEDHIKRGDTYLLFGRITGLHHDQDAKPLISFAGKLM
ncbi:flavin reductase family protein [Neorhizobium alkalisoli]|jgi:flavin reductase (DIM6/NTAB) family NADH-FMN oxidoreductase RutF|uniref:Flavin reductase (DIM6/NTAB) family NADH-FMN oxidoreductase RutF n=1 Tax=Neorhizobium alkalisoli TaxID=528178 RepID=A0A561R714_9HYPH|nr:flavin reductase family protein [Neorhizobium alkalisoli]TWF58403.1 flavin reductase (DIM6/NTAB) family NADH-FMN oxidoreductase RutF [Neorhizobium alkalisoli]